jgi:hypothetical protein
MQLVTSLKISCEKESQPELIEKYENSEVLKAKPPRAISHPRFRRLSPSPASGTRPSTQGTDTLFETLNTNSILTQLKARFDYIVIKIIIA